MSDVDVAIVGAGISGLAVAVGAVRAGLSVRLLEARPRLGGRISTVDVPGGKADLGATWFWPGELRVAALVEDLGLDVHDQWTSGDVLLAAGETVRRVGGVQLPGAYRFSGGAIGLIDGLADRLPADVIALDSPVSRVERSADQTTVHLASGSFTARATVIATPPSLAIAAGVIDPVDLDLPLRDVAASVAVWMGAITKAVAVFDRPFWRDAGLSGFVSAPDGPFNEIHDMSGRAGGPAMIFGFGQSVPNGVPLTAEAFVEQLERLFGVEAASPVAAHAINWRNERFTTPSHGPPSMRHDLFGSGALQVSAWDGRLFWASTETSHVAPGHIEGALAAAERTVAALTI